MFRYLLITLLLPIAVFAQETEVRDISDFTGIQVRDGIYTEIHQADNFEVVVSAPDGRLSDVLTELDGSDTLVVEFGQESRGGDNDFSVVVMLPDLREMENLGSGDVMISDFISASLELSVYGSGNVSAGRLEVLEAEIALYSSGDINLQSLESDDLELEVLGSGDIQIEALTAEEVDAQILGSGDISIDGNLGNVELQITGSGDFGGDALNIESIRGNIIGGGDVEFARANNNEMQRGEFDLEALFGLIEHEIEIELEGDVERSSDERIFRGNFDGGGFVDAITGFLAVLLIFGGPIILVALVAGFSYRKKKDQLETLKHFAADNQQIPAEVLASLSPQSSPKSDLRSGVILIAVGAGIAVTFISVGIANLAAIACIPAFVGLAKLAIWKFETKEQE